MFVGTIAQEFELIRRTHRLLYIDILHSIHRKKMHTLYTSSSKSNATKSQGPSYLAIAVPVNTKWHERKMSDRMLEQK